MPKIILRSNYMKNAPAEHLSNFVKYIGTRAGVEKLDKTKALLPVTVNQKQLVQQIVKDIAGTKNMLEYADYLANPTRENASEFISLALEHNLDLIGKRQNYVDYIAKRPRVERVGEHGLFTDIGIPVVLSQVQDDVANHKGAVWTHVVSLRREDAARLGYDSGKQWQALIRSKKAMLCKNMKIPSENLRWYCAFHNESHHPHVHLMVYSSKDNEGFLTEKGIEAMRSELAHDIFRQDFANIYLEQNQSKASLKQIAENAMQDLLLRMKSSLCLNTIIEKDILLLSQRLQNTNGKKQYGYLKADVKAIIDRIVDELAKTDTVSAALLKWQEIQNNLLNTYQDKLPEPLPLSQLNEFKSIKNMVIKEALNIADGVITFEPVAIDDTDTAPTDEDTELNADWSIEYKQARIYLFGNKNTPHNFAKAFDWLLLEAEKGNALAMHDIGIMYANGLGRDSDTDMAYHWYKKSLSAFHIVEEENPKLYTQYRIGKMYNAGLGTEQSYEKAAEWFTLAANDGYKYAQYSLGGLYYKGNGVEQNYETALALYIESDKNNFPYASYELAKMYGDGVGTIQNTAKAEECFKKAFYGFSSLDAQSHDDKLQYRLGQMLVTGTGVEKNVAKAIVYFEKSSDKGNQYAQYQLGKLYLFGKDIEQDKEKALEYFTLSAAQGNEYAQFFIDHMNDCYEPSVMLCATRLLHHLSDIFEDKAKGLSSPHSIQIDSKQRRKTQAKKMAQGHAHDDYEQSIQM